MTMSFIWCVYVCVCLSIFYFLCVCVKVHPFSLPFLSKVTAAKGAEAFYQTENNDTRSEGLELACERDSKAAEVRV